MADLRRRSEAEELTDDETYEPSNEGNPEHMTHEENQEHTIEEEGGLHGRINPLDYVSSSHPLLPPPRSRKLDSADALKNRVRSHPAFWWDVILAMHERAQPGQAQGDDAGLRLEISRLNKEIDELRREKEQENATAEVAKLTKKVEWL